MNTQAAVTPKEAITGLDEAFTRHGFEQVNAVGRAIWKGQWDGRAAQVNVSQQSRTRYAGEIRYRQRLGFRIRVQLATTVQAKIFFVKSGFTNSRIIRFIYRLKGQHVIEEVPSELDGFHIVTNDVESSRRLMAKTSAMQAAGLLLRNHTEHDPNGANLQGSVHAIAEKLHYATPIVPDTVLVWGSVVEALERLSVIAEAGEQVS